MMYQISEIHKIDDCQRETSPQWSATLTDLNDDSEFYLVVVLSNHGRYEASASVVCSSSKKLENSQMVLALSNEDRPLSEWKEGDLVTPVL